MTGNSLGSYISLPVEPKQYSVKVLRREIKEISGNERLENEGK